MRGQKNSKRRVPRNFLSNKDKKNILELKDCSLKEKEIAEKLSLNIRQVKTFLNQKEKGQVNVFTQEEDETLIKLYNQDIKKEAAIAKYLVKKSPWMIRNRIKTLKRKGRIIDTINSTIVLEENVSCVEQFSGQIGLDEKGDCNFGMEFIDSLISFDI